MFFMPIYKKSISGCICGMMLCISFAYAQFNVKPPVPIDSSLIHVKFQEKKEYSFNKGSIHFSNKFSSARYNGVSQLDDSTFVVIIEPESKPPINRSPWYAFKVWSNEPRDIHIQLSYPTTT